MLLLCQLTICEVNFNVRSQKVGMTTLQAYLKVGLLKKNTSNHSLKHHPEQQFCTKFMII